MAPVAAAQYGYGQQRASFFGFSNGTLPYRKGDKWGFVDRDNRFLLAPRFDSLLYAGPGYCLVKEGGASLLLTEDMDTITDFRTLVGNIGPVKLKPEDPAPAVRYLPENAFEITYRDNKGIARTVYGTVLKHATGNFWCYQTLDILRTFHSEYVYYKRPRHPQPDTYQYFDPTPDIRKMSVTAFAADSSLLTCVYTDGRVLRETIAAYAELQPPHYCGITYRGHGYGARDSVSVLDLRTGRRLSVPDAQGCHVSSPDGVTRFVFWMEEGFLLTDENGTALLRSQEELSDLSGHFLATLKPWRHGERGYTIYKLPEMTVFKDSVIAVHHLGSILCVTEGKYMNLYAKQGRLFHAIKPSRRLRDLYYYADLTEDRSSGEDLIVVRGRKEHRLFSSTGKLLLSTPLEMHASYRDAIGLFEFDLHSEQRNNGDYGGNAYYIPETDTLVVHMHTDSTGTEGAGKNLLFAYRSGKVVLTDLFGKPVIGTEFDEVNVVGDYFECQLGDSYTYLDRRTLQPVSDTLQRLWECGAVSGNSSKKAYIYGFRQKTAPGLTGIRSEALGIWIPPKYASVSWIGDAFFVVLPSGKKGYVRMDGTELFED